MNRARTLGVVALGLVVLSQPFHGQTRSGYRNFLLGGSLPSVSALSGLAASEAKIIHLRPALMQELQWRRGYFTSDLKAQTDPVQQIVFSFYNDQLTKLVVDYDRDRTVGMTDADMIDALSTEYGPPQKSTAKTSRAAASPIDADSGVAVARWGAADYSVVLYRSPYASGFRIIVASTQLEALARTAAVEAVRLDEREAPQREIARQKKEAEDARISEEKARLSNKAAFRP